MINFKKLNNFRIEISYSTEEEFEIVDKYLSTKYRDRIYNYKQKKWDYNQIIEVKFYENKNKMIIHKGLSLSLMKYLDSRGTEYIYDLNESPRLKIINKWYDIFKSNPKEENGKIQLEAIDKVENNNLGIISLFTGVGKTELLLSIVESFLNQKSGNIVIISYSSKVLEEIKLRAEKYSIEIGDRIKILNPTFYYKSNNSKLPESIEWVNNVRLAVVDEAHHFASLNGTWARFIEECDPEYLYAFTASADIKSGKELNPELFLEEFVDPKLYCMVSFCGNSLIHKELPVPIHITRVHTTITNEAEYEDFKENNPFNLNKLIKLFLTNKKTPKILSYIINNFFPKDSLCFIPELTDIETGVFLATELNNLGIATVYFSGSKVITPIGEVQTLKLEDLKELALTREFKVLISNIVGVEGLDLPNLNSVIPLTGASYKNFIQPLGRSARGEEIYCALVFDTHNNQLNNQMNSKYKIMKERLKIISDKRIVV